MISESIILPIGMLNKHLNVNGQIISEVFLNCVALSMGKYIYPRNIYISRHRRLSVATDQRMLTFHPSPKKGGEMFPSASETFGIQLGQVSLLPTERKTNNLLLSGCFHILQLNVVEGLQFEEEGGRRARLRYRFFQAVLPKADSDMKKSTSTRYLACTKKIQDA